MIADDLERWANMGIFGLDVQVYDLTATTDFVHEICEANIAANAPLFASGLPPAKSFMIIINGTLNEPICMMIRRVSESHVQCDLMQALEVHHCTKETEKYRDETCKVAIELRSKIGSMLQDAPHDVCDMLGISANDPLGDFDRKYIVNEGAELPEEDKNLAVIEIGAPCPYDKTWLSAILHLCSAACEFMAMPIAAVTPSQIPRAARRRLERTGRGVSLVTVNVTRSISTGQSRQVTGEHGRALHFVSGHWRLSEASLHRRWVFDDWRIWIEGHWRGDSAYGVLLHRYVARAEQLYRH